MSPTSVDITPTPRILRVLGDIPFDVWQCYAELIDNSLDAMAQAEVLGVEFGDPSIDIMWSSEEVGRSQREIVIQDSGPGMDLNAIANAAKAGYSSNDPIHNLGLFGMGFNIATARLGEETTILSTREGEEEWRGIKIDFTEMIRGGHFDAPVISRKKSDKSKHGTKIVVGKLKEGVLSELRIKKSRIRKRLENVYSPVLEARKVDIRIDGRSLDIKSHCVWGESRYVRRRDYGDVCAIQEIDTDFGKTLFDLSKNRYLTQDESIEIGDSGEKEDLPANLVWRDRRLKGWIGIQRYSDPSDFGIDFIRNGRKILSACKDLFSYENPDTGGSVLEYPLELGTTLGGRIVGELNVDYLMPTYQKDAFDYSDPSWRLTLEAIRGIGPLLPKQRKILGYDGVNQSPLGKLVNAYRRNDPGTKNLAIPNAKAKELHALFLKGDTSYLSDHKWFSIAREIDREKNEELPVDPGVTPSDDISDFLPIDSGESNEVESPSKEQSEVKPPEDSEPATLRQNSEKIESLCGSYKWGATGKLTAEVRRINADYHILIDGKFAPVLIDKDGTVVEFFYDSNHPLIKEFPLSPKQWLLNVLAESFSLRDRVPYITALIGLYENHMEDERVNADLIRLKASNILSRIKEKLPAILVGHLEEAFKIIFSVSGVEEEIANRILESNPEGLELLKERDPSILAYCPEKVVGRLFDELPQAFFDKAVFRPPYSGIVLSTDEATVNVRNNLAQRFSSYIKDIIFINSADFGKLNKIEFIRFSKTIEILENSVVE